MTANPEVIHESIYDHPKYYDLVFGADTAAERTFIRDAAEVYADGLADWFFEPACGTGRLMSALAGRGCRVAGLDLNPAMVDFCNARLRRRGFAPSAVVADMADFTIDDLAGVPDVGGRPRRCVAFNTINSFRHLATEADAKSHLQCVGQIVGPGGLYLLGIHLSPTKAPPSETESWSASRGRLSMQTHMWTIERLPKKRLERFGIYFDITTPSKTFRIQDELVLRSYTKPQMQRLIDSAGCWDVVAAHDFGYDIESAITIDATTEDVVYVLRRRD